MRVDHNPFFNFISFSFPHLLSIVAEDRTTTTSAIFLHYQQISPFSPSPSLHAKKQQT
jgi:hypothetical protein